METEKRREKSGRNDEEGPAGPSDPEMQGWYARTYLLSVLKDAAGDDSDA